MLIDGLLGFKFNNVIIKHVSFHSTIKCVHGKSHYVFKLECSDDIRYICQCRKINYCDVLDRYYINQPFYLGDYFLYISNGQWEPFIKQCQYDGKRKCFTITQNDFILTHYCYRFTDHEQLMKAKKLFDSNKPLALTLFNGNLIKEGNDYKT